MRLLVNLSSASSTPLRVVHWSCSKQQTTSSLGSTSLISSSLSCVLSKFFIFLPSFLYLGSFILKLFFPISNLMLLLKFHFFLSSSHSNNIFTKMSPSFISNISLLKSFWFNFLPMSFLLASYSPPLWLPFEPQLWPWIAISFPSFLGYSIFPLWDIVKPCKNMSPFLVT